MWLLCAPSLWSRLLLLLCVLLPTIPCCAGLDDADVWSGHIWDEAQKARNKQAMNSDRLMQHIWQRPDQADKFVDCDILADSQTDKHFQFLNLYDADADAERENLLAGLPADGYVRGMWPIVAGKATVPYQIMKKLDDVSQTNFELAIQFWQKAASVKFTKSSKKPNLEVVMEGGCFATLGYHATEPRKLSMFPDRCSMSVTIHLLGHVLGLPHPTSTVGRANEQYLMPHHAAPRSMGVLSSRAGAAFDPFDIMAVDPWFCGVHNRSTWRLLSPSQYRWAMVTGSWIIQRNYEKHSASVGLLQREIQAKAGTAFACKNKCADPCKEFLTPECKCVKPFEMNDDTFKALRKEEARCWGFDMGTEKPKSCSMYIVEDRKPKVFASANVCSFFYSTDDGGVSVADDSGTRCWQCTLFVFTVHTGGMFDSKQNQLIALGSRCTLFSLELNGVLEEAWYRLCMHHLLDNNKGDVQLAFRGPGTVLIRYFSSKGVFKAFHNQFIQTVKFSWSVQKVANCQCSDGPGVEMQYSVNKQ